MKRILAVICVLMMLVSGCGKGSQPKVAREKEILKAISGEYLNCDDLKDFKRTKSTKNSLSAIRMMRISRGSVDIGDGHQGISLGKVENAVETENKSYTFDAFENDENNIKGEFFPESGILKCTVKTNYAMGKSTIHDYMRFDSYDAIAMHLGSILFDGIDAIEKNGEKFVSEIGGKKVYLQVSPDTAEPMISNEYMGSIFISEEGASDRKIAFYTYENEKLTLFDEEGTKIAQF